MRLSAIRPGDLVLVNDGLPYHAEVQGKADRRLHVRPLHSGHNPKPVKAGDVVAHWRRMGRA